jgi:hypothetical protein
MGVQAGLTQKETRLQAIYILPLETRYQASNLQKINFFP